MIRFATIEDLPELMRMAFGFHKEAKYRRLASFEESVDSWRCWLENCTKNPDALCVVAEGEKGLIGFATAVVFAAYWNRDIRAVQETAFWVDPGHRSTGVGSAILEKIIEWAHAVKARVVAAGSTVYMNPKRMGAFLRRHGFRLEERHYSREVKCLG